uniref:Uncharacterized protein n=1 Tax=Salix viminalis TaxID=40686 RepID=A0A6N2KJ27_SALVM
MLNLGMLGQAVKGERKTSARFVRESSGRGFLSLNFSEGKTREQMEGDPIIIDELLVLKDTITGTRTPTKTRVGGSHIPLPKSQTNITPLKTFIMYNHCKKKWMTERNQLREDIVKHRADRSH